MLIGYSNKDTEKICNDDKVAKKKLGNAVSTKLFQRLQWLSKAPNLEFFNSTYRFLRVHKLSGNYDGMYALDINKQYRIVFYPCDEYGDPNYDDFKAISVVTIQEVSKHYEW